MPAFPAGHHTRELGDMPDPAELPTLPTFTPAGALTTPLDILADAALGKTTSMGSHDGADDSAGAIRSLHSAGPYNPAAALPPKVVKKILALEFVEMAELRADIWPEDSSSTEGAGVVFLTSLKACSKMTTEKPALYAIHRACGREKRNSNKTKTSRPN